MYDLCYVVQHKHKRPLSHNLMKEYEAVMASDFVTAIYAFMTEQKLQYNKKNNQWNSLQQAHICIKVIK